MVATCISALQDGGEHGKESKEKDRDKVRKRIGKDDGEEQRGIELEVLQL